MSSPDLLYHLEQAIVAFERDGEDGLLAACAAAGDQRAEVLQQIDTLRRAGLLQPPEWPERLGAWRIVRRLGSGGMGTVFLAEQTEPMARRAAIKVIRAGMDSREVLARFALERQALALLDHPGIARVLDAGQTEQGRPYLVMDYVEGRSLQAYCDERRLEPERRIELFVQVCDAVQHAHQKGLLHRDLKPSNVLVGERDGAPFPVVIDFGVAKSVGARLGHTALTLPGHLLGTPEYMSPEQARNHADVDTRTDVYSLGVVLYELLTGTLPVDATKLRSADVSAVLGSVEPPTPSTRLTRLGDAAIAIAEQRGTSVGALRRTLRGDLDWIVMKALERDRDRRYGMPGELAADLRRYLRDEPVTAGPPTRWYRFRKYCSRHRLQVSAAVLAGAALTVGLTISTLFWREARASAVEKTATLDAALHAVGELVQIGDLDLVTVPHMENVRRDLLRRSVAVYRGFLGRGTIDDPRLVERTLDALVRLGNMQAQLGEDVEALQHLDEASGLLASTAAIEHVAPATRRRIEADLLLDRGRILERRFQVERSVDLARAATPLARELANAPGAATADRRRLVRALLFEGKSLAEREPATALALLDEATTVVEAERARRPDDPAALTSVIGVGIERARQLRLLGRPDDCLAAIETLRTLRRSHAQPDSWPLVDAVLPMLDLLHACERPREVVAVSNELQPALDRLVGDHPSILPYRRALVVLWNARANAQMMDNGVPQALESQAVVQRLCEEGLAQSPDNAPLRRHLVISCLNIALCQNELLRSDGNWDAAEVDRVLRRALELLDSLPSGEGQRQARGERMEALALRGKLRESQGDFVAARGDQEAALAIADELVAESPTTVHYPTRLVELLRRYVPLLLANGHAADALPAIDRALVLCRRLEESTVAKRRMIDRRREFLLCGLRAKVITGDVAGGLAALDEHLTLGLTHDWIGRQSAIEALARLLAQLPADAAPRDAVLARGRALLAEALASEADAVARGTGHGTIAVMRGNTLTAARDLEAAGGDLVAAARHADAVLTSYAEVWPEPPRSRGENRMRDAFAARLALAWRAGDVAALTATAVAAAERLAGRADALATLAAAASSPPAGTTAPPPTELATAARANGVALARAARAAGLPAAALAAPRFDALRAEPTFAELAADVPPAAGDR